MIELLSSRQFLVGRELPVRVLRRDPQPEYPPHSHEFAELVMVFEGSGSHVVYGESSNLAAGDVFVIHPGTVHAYENLHALKLLNIIFDLNALNSPLSEYSSCPAFQALFMLEPASRGTRGLQLPKEKLAPLLRLAERIEAEEIHHQTGYSAMISGLFIEMVVLLGRYYFDHARNPVRRPLLQIGKVINAVSEDCSQSWTRPMMAQIAGMSESSLTRAFKQYTSYAPGEYLLRFRIRKAAALVLDNDRRISEIGFSVGFHDSNYFSRQFRNLIGMSPRQFRQKTVNGK